MTTHAISDHDASHLLRTMHGGNFRWQVSDLPELLRSLDWTIAEEVAGKGAIADTKWNVPDADVEMTFSDDAVQSITMNVTGPKAEGDADRNEVQNAFAHLTKLIVDTYGPPAASIKGAAPRLRWQDDQATVTLHNFGFGLQLVWSSNAFQKLVDAAGMS